MQDEFPPSLPDAAFTVLELGGFRALREYAEAGLLLPGRYACPYCSGQGITPGKNPKRPKQCAHCKGAKGLKVIVQTIVVFA